MSDDTDDASETEGARAPAETERVDELLRLNAALDGQVRQLVRAEQRLFLSQRDLARQLARLDSLNRFAIDVAGLDRAASILERAADVLFALFPLDQYLAFLRLPDGRLEPAVVRAVPGREARDRATVCEPQALGSDAPIFGRADELRGRAELAPLIDATERTFAAPDEDPGRAWTLVLPMSPHATAPAGAEGALVFRRRSGPLSFHEELPNERDFAFLGLFTKQVAASLTSARLLEDLRASYQRLDEAQRERVQRERLAALGELSAVVAHEVRNPLGAIFNAVSVLGKLVHGEGDAATMISIVREESHRLNQIVSDLLDFARPHAPAPRAEPLWPMIESGIASVKVRFPSARIEARDEAPGVRVLADARMVRQAIINLLLNGVHAAPEGTVVEARVSAREGMACIEIADRGAGVPAPLAERVFEPFFTTRPSGTGLGLSVVRRVAETHCGTVELRAREGGGAVFVLCLPRSEDDSRAESVR